MKVLWPSPKLSRPANPPNEFNPNGVAPTSAEILSELFV